MSLVVGNFNDMKWMEKFNEKGEYRGRKKIFPGEKASFQIMEFCNGHAIHPHSHSYEQLALILQGTCDFYCDGKKYRLTEGSFMAIPPNVEHYIHVHDSLVPVINLDVFIPARPEYVEEYQKFLAEHANDEE